MLQSVSGDAQKLRFGLGGARATSFRVLSGKGPSRTRGKNMQQRQSKTCTRASIMSLPCSAAQNLRSYQIFEPFALLAGYGTAAAY